MKYKIYTLTCPLTSEVRYIGRTIDTLNSRLSKHVHERKKHKNHRCHWINKLYNQGLKPTIELLDETEDRSRYFELETYWIYQFESWGFDLVNETHGGEGSFGYKHTPESLQKIKEANERRWKNHVKIPIRRMSKKEQNAFISKRLSIPIVQYDMKGNKTKVWNSLNEVKRSYKCSSWGISSALKDTKRISLGSFWRYKSEENRDKIEVSPYKGNKSSIAIYDSLTNETVEFKSLGEAFNYMGSRPSNPSEYIDRDKLFKKRYKLILS